jgi:hypothetical protein
VNESSTVIEESLAGIGATIMGRVHDDRADVAVTGVEVGVREGPAAVPARPRDREAVEGVADDPGVLPAVSPFVRQSGMSWEW